MRSGLTLLQTGHVTGPTTRHIAGQLPRQTLDAVAASPRDAVDTGDNDHDAGNSDQVGSADGDRSDACRPAADLSIATLAFAILADADHAAEAPSMNSQSSSCAPAESDKTYTWGESPSTYFTPRELGRLMFLRWRLSNRETLRNRVCVLPETGRAV